MVVDDGWAAAKDWQQRVETMERYAERAVRQNREVILLGTAPDPEIPVFRRFGAADAMPSITSWQPKPWPIDRDKAIERLADETLDDAEIVWLSDGLAHDDAALGAARRFSSALRDLGPLTVLVAPPGERAIILDPPDSEQVDLIVRARRGAGGLEQTMAIRALGPKGEVLARQPLRFDQGSDEAETEIDLPLDLRNEIARVEIENRAEVGSTVLLDERWRRRSVGLVGLGAERMPQPLLSELYYVERALRQQAEIIQGNIQELLERDLSAIVLTDSAQISDEHRSALDDWISAGGVLLRFAGPRLASASLDDLVPVPLRRGDRFLDGTLVLGAAFAARRASMRTTRSPA